MVEIFYFGTDGNLYGPETELTVQGWYASGYFSSDIKFQISPGDQRDPNGLFITLGELIELNGRALPFHFSAEKATQEMKQEIAFDQLTQEVESLRAKCDNQHKEQSEGREMLVLLQNQVAALVEVQTDLRRQLNPLTNQKDNASVPRQLEKKVTEVKKKVDDQEKNLASMKKELSAVNSKCDRTDGKIEKFLEGQKKTEGTVTRYDKRIYDLEVSEKNIRSSIISCEQNATSNTAEIESIKHDLSEVKTVLETQRQVSSTNKSQIESVRREVDGALEMIHSHKVEFTKNIDEILQYDDETKETELAPWDDEKVEDTLIGRAKYQSEDDDAFPWEREETNEHVSKLPVKTQFNSSAPVEAIEECTTLEVDGGEDDDAFPWEREEKKEPLSKVPVKKQFNSSAPVEVIEVCTTLEVDGDEDDAPPWEKEEKEAVLHTVVKKTKDMSPWDEATSEESAPWDDEENSSGINTLDAHNPWDNNRYKSVKGRKTEKGLLIDQNGEMAAQMKDEKAVTGAKPVTRVKNWDAICRELSDDEEVEESSSMGTSPFASAKLREMNTGSRSTTNM